MVKAMSFDEATALLEAERSGAGDDPLRNPPLLVVNVDGCPVSSELVAPSPLWPCVVVAVGSGARRPPRGADLYISSRPDADSPWVGFPGALDRVAEAVSSNPDAARTLVQVLRSGGEEIEHDLIMESLAYASLQGGSEHRGWLARQVARAPADPGSPATILDRVDDTLRVTLNRPRVRNAYSARMRDELIVALQLASADPAISNIELRAHGADFSSGGDLSEFGTVADPAVAHQVRMARNAGLWLHRLSAKTTAYVHGSCVGAGVELPAFAGGVVADGSATFRLPEVAMGLIPGAGGTASIPRRVGAPRTAWLALSGESIDARTALSWGLIDSIQDGPA